MAKAIIYSVIYLDQLVNCLSAAKDTLHMAKIVADLIITCNKSEMTQKSNLASNFPNTKAVKGTNIICNNV